MKAIKKKVAEFSLYQFEWNLRFFPLDTKEREKIICDHKRCMGLEDKNEVKPK